MTGRAIIGVVGAVAIFVLAIYIGTLIGMDHTTRPDAARTVTVREQPINNNKTVPLKETHTENNHYYTQPCKGTLPDTGGQR